MKREPLPADMAGLLAEYALTGMDLSGAALLTFAPGEVFLREGEPIADLLFVVSGRASVMIGVSNGRRLLLSYFVSRGIIGDVELMRGEGNAFTTMQAVTEFVCIGLPMRSYAARLLACLPFVNRVGRELAGKLMQSNLNGAVTILHSVESRLCSYLLETAGDGWFTETRTSTADLLGCSYRQLLRCLKELCGAGILQKQSKGYRIVNRDALRSRAGDAYRMRW